MTGFRESCARSALTTTTSSAHLSPTRCAMLASSSAPLAAQHADCGKHDEAAEELLAVAEALRSRGLRELAEAFAIRAAESLTSAGELPRARELLLEAVWARLDRGQPASAHSLLSTLHRLRFGGGVDRRCRRRGGQLARAP